MHASDVRAFCVGHVAPVFEPGLPYNMLTPRPLGLAGEMVVPDARWGPGGGELAEYAQLFGLAERVEAGEVQAARLYLFQYRKFIGLREGGQPANAPWVRIAAPDEAARLVPTLAELAAVPHPVTVGSMFALGASVAQNYALVHVIDDLVAFAACLPEAGVAPAEVRRFASFQGLLPSPALCLVDTPVFVQHMRVLRRAWEAYARHARVRREGYQMRVAGYLLERLHSHLLCQGLLDGSASGVGLGHRYVVLRPDAPAKAESLPAEQSTAAASSEALA